MTHAEYLKQIEHEIRKLNRVIDYKILNGEKYSKEAREHKSLLEIIWKHQFKNNPGPVKSNLFSKFFGVAFQH